MPNFDYSDANKSSGIVWNEETFEDYIKNPAAKVPGTKMIFPGIKNEQQENPSHCGMNFSADLLHPAQLHADVSLSAINTSMIFQGLGDFLQ